MDLYIWVVTRTRTGLPDEVGNLWNVPGQMYGWLLGDGFVNSRVQWTIRLVFIVFYFCSFPPSPGDRGNWIYLINNQ